MMGTMLLVTYTVEIGQRNDYFNPIMNALGLDAYLARFLEIAEYNELFPSTLFMKNSKKSFIGNNSCHVSRLQHER